MKFVKIFHQQLLLIAVLCVINCLTVNLNQRPHLKQKVKEVNVNVPISTNITDYFDNYSGEMVDLSQQLPSSFNKVGKHEVPLQIGSYTYTQVFDVKDSVPPKIFINDRVITDISDVSSVFKVTDDSDVTLTFARSRVANKWMSHGMALYNVTCMAKDAFNNSNELSTLVLVTGGKPFVSSLNIDYSQPLDKCIDQYLDYHGLDHQNIAYGYYNFETKESNYYQKDKFMVGASTYKLPLNMIYCDLLNDLVLEKDDTLVFKKSDYEIGAGTLEVNYNFNDKIEIEELMHESLYWSNNSASRILVSNLGGFAAFQQKASVYSPDSGYENNKGRNITSVQFLMDCLRYLATNYARYSDIINILSKASDANYGRYITSIPLMHKYGSYEQALNDCGIVFGPIPFAFVILGNEISEIDLGNIVNIMVFKTLNAYLRPGVDYNK